MQKQTYLFSYYPKRFIFSNKIKRKFQFFKKMTSKTFLSYIFNTVMKKTQRV